MQPAEWSGSRHALVNRRLFGCDEDMMSSMLAALPQGLQSQWGILLSRQRLTQFTLLSCVMVWWIGSGRGRGSSSEVVESALTARGRGLSSSCSAWTFSVAVLCFAVSCRLGEQVRWDMRQFQTCSVSQM